MEMFTVRMHRASTKPGASSSSSDPEKLSWQGEHVLTHHKVTVCPRTDRRPMISMYEQGCQICQIHLDTFRGNIGTQRKSAFDLMVEIAMAYTSDTITKGQLLQVRGDKVEAMGLGRPKRGRKAKRHVAASDGADLPDAGVSVAASDGADLPGARVSNKRRLAVRRRPAAATTRRRPAAAAVPAQAAQYTVDDMHVHSRNQGYTSRNSFSASASQVVQ